MDLTPYNNNQQRFEADQTTWAVKSTHFDVHPAQESTKKFVILNGFGPHKKIIETLYRSLNASEQQQQKYCSIIIRN